MANNKNRVCPVERAGSLDNVFRKIIHNPKRLLKDYVKKGMTVLDFGCGPGLFSVAMAEMVGESGKVIAVDLQAEMLAKLQEKIDGTDIEGRIELHKTESGRIGVGQKIDFALCFYVIHELPDQKRFFAELKDILKPDGQVFIAEPNFHVSKEDFEKTLTIAKKAGFKEQKKEKVFLSRALVLTPGVDFESRID